MIFKYLILLWGVLEFILGITVVIKRDLLLLKFIVESFSVLNSDFSMDKINNIKVFSKWFGEIVTLEGSLYIFLASASIFFNMSIIIVIIFIIIIEVFFFNVIINGIKNFI